MSFVVSRIYHLEYIIEEGEDSRKPWSKFHHTPDLHILLAENLDAHDTPDSQIMILRRRQIFVE